MSEIIENLTSEISLDFPLHFNEFNGNKQEIIGEGINSLIKLVKNKNSDTYYAIKIINRDNIEEAENEMRILNKLKHLNIIQYFDYYKDKNKIYLLLELAENGNLKQYLRMKNVKVLDENEFFPIFWQLCLALEYLHKNYIVHSNLTVNS